MPTAAIIPEVSIVIPSWNGLPLLEPCLAAVSALTGVRFQAIVVDNGSTDGTAEFVTERHPEVKLVRLSSNRGFAAAANAGFRAADTQYVALLNNDVVVAPAWLAELVACGERHPRAAAVASKLLRPDEATIDRVGDLLARNLRAYPQGASERDRGQYDEEREVFSVSGAACLWRARVFEELGGFDEGFFFAYEDVDLGLRARLRGFECWTAPRSLALHRGSATAGASPVFVHYHPTVGRWRMIVRSTPGAVLVLALPAVLVAEVATLLLAVRRRVLRQLIAAYARVLRELPGLVRDRRAVQAGRTVSSVDLWLRLAPWWKRALRAHH